jgi:hypothetical protein
VTEREKTPFPFCALQVDRSWYQRYWESDPPPPRREVFVGSLFLVLLTVAIVLGPIASKMRISPMEQAAERGSLAHF